MKVIRSRKTIITEIIYETLNFFEKLYPAEYQQMIDDMTALRGASAPTYKARGEDVYVSFKVPTVLYLGIRYITECRRIQPPFGQSADDIALLANIAKAFNGGARKQAGVSLVLPKGFHERIYGKKEDPHAATGSDEPSEGDRGAAAAGAATAADDHGSGLSQPDCEELCRVPGCLPEVAEDVHPGSAG